MEASLFILWIALVTFDVLLEESSLAHALKVYSLTLLKEAVHIAVEKNVLRISKCPKGLFFNAFEKSCSCRSGEEYGKNI